MGGIITKRVPQTSIRIVTVRIIDVINYVVKFQCCIAAYASSVIIDALFHYARSGPPQTSRLHSCRVVNAQGRMRQSHGDRASPWSSRSG